MTDFVFSNLDQKQFFQFCFCFDHFPNQPILILIFFVWFLFSKFSFFKGRVCTIVWAQLQILSTHFICEVKSIRGERHDEYKNHEGESQLNGIRNFMKFVYKVGLDRVNYGKQWIISIELPKPKRQIIEQFTWKVSQNIISTNNSIIHSSANSVFHIRYEFEEKNKKERRL